MRKALILSLVFSLCWARNSLASDDVIVVHSNHLDCLLENAMEYLESSLDPLIVFLELCPIVEVTPQDLTELTENISFIVIPDSNAEYDVTQILVIDKSQIECLTDPPSGVIRYFESAPEFVQLDLGACP